MSGNWPCYSDNTVTVLDMGYTSTTLLISEQQLYQVAFISDYGSEKGT